jgi:hypothetical protein
MTEKDPSVAGIASRSIQPLTEGDLSVIESFRSGVESLAGARLGLPAFTRHDREDHWTMATRWLLDRRWWLEMAIRPTLPQIRVGVVTDDGDRSRDAEQMISDLSLTIREFVGLGFKAAGLDWPEPPVEHYREGADRFCFATPLDLTRLSEMAGEEIREKTRRMLDGYRRCFLGRIAG